MQIVQSRPLQTKDVSSLKILITAEKKRVKTLLLPAGVWTRMRTAFSFFGAGITCLVYSGAQSTIRCASERVY